MPAAFAETDAILEVEDEPAITVGALNFQSRRANDVDNIITNKLLRAESGSTSIWSVGTSLEYAGGNLRKPLSEDRPNIASTTATTDKAFLDGQADVKYNISSQHSLSAGIGVRWITPFSSERPRGYDGKRVDVANPFLNYQLLYNLGGLQSVLQVQPTIYTESNLTRLGYHSSLLVNQDSVIELGDSGFTVGFSVWAQYVRYDKEGSSGDPNDPDDYTADVRTEQADYIFGLSSVLEYMFNDTFNLRTVLYLYNYEHMRSEPDRTTYAKDTITQSFGLGISITPVIFLYPNIQFVPEDIRDDLTNVGISADISVF